MWFDEIVLVAVSHSISSLGFVYIYRES
jgi:hypothetical protein